MEMPTDESWALFEPFKLNGERDKDQNPPSSYPRSGTPHHIYHRHLSHMAPLVHRALLGLLLAAGASAAPNTCQPHWVMSHREVNYESAFSLETLEKR